MAKEPDPATLGSSPKKTNVIRGNLKSNNQQKGGTVSSRGDVGRVKRAHPDLKENSFLKNTLRENSKGTPTGKMLRSILGNENEGSNVTNANLELGGGSCQMWHGKPSDAKILYGTIAMYTGTPEKAGKARLTLGEQAAIVHGQAN